MRAVQQGLRQLKLPLAAHQDTSRNQTLQVSFVLSQWSHNGFCQAGLLPSEAVDQTDHLVREKKVLIVRPSSKSVLAQPKGQGFFARNF